MVLAIPHQMKQTINEPLQTYIEHDIDEFERVNGLRAQKLRNNNKKACTTQSLINILDNIAEVERGRNKNEKRNTFRGSSISCPHPPKDDKKVDDSNSKKKKWKFTRYKNKKSLKQYEIMREKIIVEKLLSISKVKEPEVLVAGREVEECSRRTSPTEHSALVEDNIDGILPLLHQPMPRLEMHRRKQLRKFVFNKISPVLHLQKLLFSSNAKNINRRNNNAVISRDLKQGKCTWCGNVAYLLTQFCASCGKFQHNIQSLGRNSTESVNNATCTRTGGGIVVTGQDSRVENNHPNKISENTIKSSEIKLIQMMTSKPLNNDNNNNIIFQARRPSTSSSTSNSSKNKRSTSMRTTYHHHRKNNDTENNGKQVASRVNHNIICSTRNTNTARELNITIRNSNNTSCVQKQKPVVNPIVSMTQCSAVSTSYSTGITTNNTRIDCTNEYYRNERLRLRSKLQQKRVERFLEALGRQEIFPRRKLNNFLLKLKQDGYYSVNQQVENIRGFSEIHPSYYGHYDNNNNNNTLDSTLNCETTVFHDIMTFESKLFDSMYLMKSSSSGDVIPPPIKVELLETEISDKDDVPLQHNSTDKNEDTFIT